MEAATLTPLAAGVCSFDRPARCEPVVPRDREPRTCGGRRPSACAAETSVAALRYRRSERTALYIETQEGDVVRLRIKVRSALDAKVGASKGEVNLEEMRVSARSDVKIRFSVDGDLNAEELAAVRSVVAQASGLAAELFAGDAPEAFATAAALEIDGAELARVALKLSVREHLTYSWRGSYRPAPAPLPPKPEQPEPAPSEPATDAPAAEPPAPAAETPTAASAAPAAASGAVVDATDTPAEPVTADAAPADAPRPATSTDSTSSALDTIAKFLAHLLDALAEPAPAVDGDAPSIALSLKLRVFKSVALTLAATQVAAPEEPASGVPLLGETLDALAAHEAPLDARA